MVLHVFVRTVLTSTTVPFHVCVCGVAIQTESWQTVSAVAHDSGGTAGPHCFLGGIEWEHGPGHSWERVAWMEGPHHRATGGQEAQLLQDQLADLEVLWCEFLGMFHTAVCYGVGVWGPVQRHVCCTAYTAVLIRQDIVLVFMTNSMKCFQTCTGLTIGYDRFHELVSKMYMLVLKSISFYST